MFGKGVTSSLLFAQSKHRIFLDRTFPARDLYKCFLSASPGFGRGEASYVPFFTCVPKDASESK
jgi:hypothetical protein